MNYQKPLKLKSGDSVAIVSPSRGGPSLFPAIYENGIIVLKEWGLKIKEMPSARMDDSRLYGNPILRANDINNAFADKEIKAIFCTIGGDDSVRILKYLNKEIIKNNPKVLIGYSDTTTLHTFCNTLGVVTFYGPSIMAGFSQMENLPSSFKRHTYEMLFISNWKYVYQHYDKYCEGYPDWSDPKNVGKVNKLKKTNDWNFAQGEGIFKGNLFGGCIEVLEFMKGTDFWPNKDFWKGKLLFFETSEDVPSVNQIKHFLRNYGIQGVFDKINGIIFGRVRGYSDKQKKELSEMILKIVNEEFGKNELPIVTDVDFGHTDPQIVLPLGINASIDFYKRKISLEESCFKD